MKMNIPFPSDEKRSVDKNNYAVIEVLYKLVAHGSTIPHMGLEMC